jgi:Na+/proline symporter
VLGVGGDDYYIGGMTYISHLAPTAITLLALALVRAPAAAGVALAAAAGLGFYPAFMAPAWLGHYWDRPRSRWTFAAGFAIAALAIAIPVLLMSRAAAGHNVIGTILSDTFGHHTDPRHYGFSPFSFWGQRQGIRGWFNRPLAGASGFTTPLFLVFVAFVSATFWLARRTRPAELALVMAAVAIASSLQKIHPTGTYVAWAYPFLMIGLFAESAVAHRTQTNAQSSSIEYVAQRSAS